MSNDLPVRRSRSDSDVDSVECLEQVEKTIASALKRTFGETIEGVTLKRLRDQELS